MRERISQLSEIELSVIKVLAYSHIFHHPLRLDEIVERTDIPDADEQTILESLDGLVRAGAISHFSSYYFLGDCPSVIKKRESGEREAKKLMKVAQRMSLLIYCFPFVRAVFVSGSLSKGSVPDDADVDYFIVTNKNRLWIARTLLVLFKRIFLLGSKKYFCVNYFVDEANMEIPDQNIFTATEVSTIIPLQGNQVCEEFMRQNDWYRSFYPNMRLPKKQVPENQLIKRLSKSLIEPLFFENQAEKLDKYFMKRTYKRWTSMYGKGYTDTEFELAFRTHRGTSKNHNKNYQKRVLQTIESNMNQAISRIKTEVVNG
jgi:hypothetical protein